MTRIQWKKVGILCLVACLCFGMFASCKKKNAEQGNTTGLQGDGPGAFTVQILTEGGMAIKDIGVYVYEDESLSEMVTFAKTDKEGKIQFEAPIQEGYTVVLKDVPQGYVLEEKYVLKTLETQIVLKAELLEVDNLEDVTFKLGDVMSELTVTTYDGKTYVLSELLKEKEMVMLNFWYLGCTPCKMEFPHLQSAYEKYKDKVEILALNPVDGDDASLKEYAENLGLTLPMAQCDQGWQKAMKLIAYPTTVVIDRYGVISFIYQAYFEDAQSIEAVIEHFTAEDYEQGVVRTLEDLLTDKEEDEEKIENPTEVGGVSSFQLTARAGETVYCDVYRVDGMYMQICSSNVILEYQNQKYKPSNGVIGMVVHCKDVRTPMTIGLTNTGEETETYTITFGALAGTLNNPYTMKLGEFDVSIPAGSNEGIYYRYVAQEDGILVVRCLSATAGVPYDYTLYNLNSYANRNLESNGTKDDNGNMVVQITVKKGQTVQFSPSALPDDNGNYPAISMRFSAYMDTDTVIQEEEVSKKTYAITVTDEKRTPLESVQVFFRNAEGEVGRKLSNAQGVAALELPDGTYKAVIRLPDGYQGTTTSFELTDEQPTVSIRLEKIPETVYKEYTVKVVDINGNPLKDAVVVIDQFSGITDASGIVKLELPEGQYTALIGAPDGYIADQIANPFGDKTSITVTLKVNTNADEAPNENMMKYSVKVTDYNGTAMDNATVTFYQAGQVVTLKTVDANGVAALWLDKGDYTVTVAIMGGDYICDASGILLTQAAPEATVVAIQKMTGKIVSTLNDAYPSGREINQGATALEGMQADIINMFIFDPSQAGNYRIEASDPNAIVYYMGSYSHYLYLGDSSENDGYITHEIKEESLSDSLICIGVTGVESCVLNITRTDIVLSAEELAEWIIYSGEKEPDQSNVKQGTLQYFSLNGQDSDYNLVLGSDGFYHLGSATGKIVYVNLGQTGYRYVNFWGMLGRDGLAPGKARVFIYHRNGVFDRKEDYAPWLHKYMDCLPNGEGYYPLTEDLAYILQSLTYNSPYNWGVPEDENGFLFGEVENLNEKYCWLFNCGTLK